MDTNISDEVRIRLAAWEQIKHCFPKTLGVVELINLEQQFMGRALGPN